MGVKSKNAVYCLLLVPNLLCGLSFPDEVLVDEPVAYYRLDESVGTVAEDSSGSGLTAAYGGANLPIRGQMGFLLDGNGAIELSGSDADRSRVRVPFMLNPAETSFTLEALLQTDVIGAAQIVFQQLDVSGVGRTLLRINSSGQVDSFIGGTSRVSGISVEVGIPLHLVMVFDRSGLSSAGEAEGTLTFYVNGEKGNTIQMSGSSGVEPSIGDFLIGISKGFNGQYFNGTIDEIVFYDKVLSEARVVEHYESIDQSSMITSFNASPRGIEEGGSTVLSWTLADTVTGLAMDQGQGFLTAADGSITVSPTVTTTYTLSAADGARTEARTVTVEVGEIGPFRINEIMAGNVGPLEDEDGDNSDWLEITNLGNVVGSLDGWYLTDDPTFPTKWMIPSLEIDGGGYGLVFASGKDRVGPAGELHALFKLSQSGEYLALIEPDGVTIHHEFVPGFPEQILGVSWGLDGDRAGYFASPTPGGNNGEASLGFVSEEVAADVTRGFVDAPFQLNLSTEAIGAEIYYTTNGSEPTVEKGVLYTGPIEISTTTVLRAGAFRSGEVPTKIMTQSYIFLDDIVDQPNNPADYPSVWQPSVTADYEMDDDAKIGTEQEIKDALRSLPTLSLVMEVGDWFNNSTDPAIGGIYSNSVIARGSQWERKVSAEFFDFPHGKEIQVDAGMRIFGNASRATSRKKHNMRLVFRNVYGTSRLAFPLFGDDGEDDVVNSYLLRGQNGDSWFHPTAAQREESLYIRDQLARSLQERMGQPFTKQDHIHVYLNGIYWGVFNTIERIEADSMASSYGGNKDDWDVVKASPPSSVVVEDGTADAWEQLVAISNKNLAAAANYEAIQEYLDLENYIDWLLVNFYNGNSDWDNNNWQAGRRRTGGDRFRFFVWDSERTLLGTDVNATTKNNANRPTGIHQKLKANAEYRLLFADRVHRHFFNEGALTVGSVEEAFDGWVNELQVPLVAESARWGDAQRSAEPYSVNDEWLTEVNFQKNTYIPSRSNTVLQQLRNSGLYPAVDAPVLNRFGGEVEQGFELLMAAIEEEIFYTLDGSDPKDAAGMLFTREIELNESVIVKARSRSNGEWSALTTASFYVGTVPASSSNLALSEIHYNAKGNDEGEEFVELMNVGDQPVDLRGVNFADGIEFSFDEGANPELWVIPVGGRVVLVEHEETFANTYGDLGSLLIGQYAGGLDNGGERVALQDANGVLIDEVTYGDSFPWADAADGVGYSLVRIDPANASQEAHAWRRSVQLNGSPGTSDEVQFVGNIELDSDGDGLSDFLEFAMGSDSADGNDGLGLIKLEWGDEAWKFSYPERVGASGVRLVLEKSVDLTSWSEADNVTLTSRAVSKGSQDRVTYEISGDEDELFFRIKTKNLVNGE